MGLGYQVLFDHMCLGKHSSYSEVRGMPVNTLKSPGALGSILAQLLPHCVMLEASEPPNTHSPPNPSLRLSRHPTTNSKRGKG